MDEVWTVRAGRVPYEEARAAQKRLEAARQEGEVPDLLLLLEHPPVYTKGRRSTPDELPMGEDWYRMQGIEVTDTDRGGRVTYHGPGQLVGYPIVSLKPYGDDVHEYIRRMERLIIAALADWSIEAELIAGLTGVWTAERGRKIASIGVHVNRARDNARLRDQRQQRPPALPVDRSVRDRVLPGDLGDRASSVPRRTWTPSRPTSAIASARSTNGRRSR